MIRVIPKFPARWYMRSNTATALLSAAFAIYWGVYEFFLTSAQDNSGLDVVLAVLAAAHALYGLTLYFVLAAHHPRLAGFLGFFMFFTVSLYAFWITKDDSNTYFSVLAIAGLLSGLYGWLIATIMNGIVIALLVMLQTGDVYVNENFSVLQIVMYAVISIMTLIVWSAMSREDDEDDTKPQKKKSKGGNANLDSSILIDSITDGVAIIGKNGVIGVFNPSAEKITGWTAEEASGLDHRSVLILTDQRDQIYPDEQNPVSKAMALGEAASNTDAKLQTRSGKYIEVDILASPVKDGNNVSAVVVIFRDVSKQRSEERQRAEFISTASHEMRTPVAAIEGYLALAMNDKVSKIDSAARGYLDKAHASTQHLGKLFQDLLTAAKSEDGRLTNNPEVVELGQLLDELIEGMRFTAEKKGLLMEADFGQGQVGAAPTAEGMSVIRPVAYVHVDPERLREVITNLFDNAIKYTEEGKITIGMHIEDKQVTIDVRDTGAGIPKEDIPHLFQKFYRVDNSATRQVGGTGLGLFISRKIVELYNGRLWVESNLGEGSTFHITLPRLTNERAQELMRMENQKRAAAGQSQKPAATTAPVAAAPAAPTPTATVTTTEDGTQVTTIDATGGGQAK